MALLCKYDVAITVSVQLQRWFEWSLLCCYSIQSMSVFLWVKEWFWGFHPSHYLEALRKEPSFCKRCFTEHILLKWDETRWAYWQLEWLITRFPFHTQQTHLLLSWQPDDGSADRAIQGALLDLEQLMGGIQHGEWSQISVSISVSVFPPYFRGRQTLSQVKFICIVLFTVHITQSSFTECHTVMSIMLYQEQVVGIWQCQYITMHVVLLICVSL